MKRQNKQIEGFSLIEMGVVLGIIAVMAGSLLALSQQQGRASQYDMTAERLATIEEALDNYIFTAEHLPCPARLDQLPETATFGIATDCAAAAPAGVTDVSAIAGTADDVRIGMIPVRELNLPDSFAFDAWGSRIAYAVVKDMAIDDLTFEAYTKPASGGIQITDTAGTAIINDSTTTEDMMVAYVMLSHGPDRKGATTRAGVASVACTAGFGDSDNCDNDNTFVDATINDEASVNASFFDDLTIWKSYHMINPGIYDLCNP